MLQNIEKIVKPENLNAALRALKDGAGKAAVLAGGTSLSLSGRGGLTTLVDLSLCGLSEVKAAGQTLKMGALVPLADLAASPEVASIASGMIALAAHEAGNPMTRNLATVGGNVCQVFPWCHLPVVFLALDAEFAIAGVEKKVATAAELFAAAPRKILGDTGILKEVTVRGQKSLKGSFMKFSRSKTDRALVTIAACYRVNRGVMAGVRAVAGACAPLPQRVTQVEEVLEGRKPSRELFESISKMELSGLEIAQDKRASADYKREISRVLLERAFMVCWGKPV